MGTPSTVLSTLRPDLRDSLEEFDLVADREGYIGPEVLPVIEVSEQSGTFGVIPREELLKNPQVDRTSKGNYNELDWEFTDMSYATKERGLKGRVDDRDKKLYGNYFDAELVTAGLVRDGVLRAQEARYAALLWNTATWTGAALTSAVAIPWTMANKATAVPIDVIEAAVRAVYAGTGMWPNAAILGGHTFRNLTHCAQVIDRIVASGAGSPAKPSDVTAAMLAQVFKLNRVIVAAGSYNTSKEGQAVSFAPIWSNDFAMVARLATSNNIKEPSLGRTFHWGADGSEFGGTFETYYDEDRRGDMVRVRHEVQEKIVMPEMAHLLTNVNNGAVAG